MAQSFISIIEETIKKHWELDALTDYQGQTLQYKDIARKIEKIRILFEYGGIKPGDKIAICGRNCSQWGAAFLATLTYGAVAVPVLHEFPADNVHRIVNHSEAKLLFVGDQVWKDLVPSEMPELEGIVQLTDYALLESRSEKLDYARAHLNQIFGEKFPERFRQEHVDYRRENPEELALINYTSGTTSSSKGVMLPYRSLWSNTKCSIDKLTLKPGSKMVSMLPMAHMYGLSLEFLYSFCQGMHLYFLNRMPSPMIIFKAFNEIKPDLVVAVPLIIEKIIKKKVLPKLEKPAAKLLWHLPFFSNKLKARVRESVMNAFGGRFVEVVVGGSSFNHEIEHFLKTIKFPYTVGYGMTECGPFIAYEGWEDFREGTCGKPVFRMEVRIDSNDQHKIPGEILCRGANLMLGYYKNEEATRQAIDEHGWLHTGDLGLLDKQGNLIIKGRIKNMILGPSGQNIYPEEIENVLNNMPCISESIVLQNKAGKLVALVHPDADIIKEEKINSADLPAKFEEYRREVNQKMPVYQKISEIKIHDEEFAKTPKRSIKRFLYQDEAE